MSSASPTLLTFLQGTVTWNHKTDFQHQISCRERMLYLSPLNMSSSLKQKRSFVSFKRQMMNGLFGMVGVTFMWFSFSTTETLVIHHHVLFLPVSQFDHTVLHFFQWCWRPVVPDKRGVSEHNCSVLWPDFRNPISWWCSLLGSGVGQQSLFGRYKSQI